MSRTDPVAVVATGALSACLTLLALGPGATDAGPEAAAPPAARAGEVTFDTKLVSDGEGAAVRIHARSSAARARSCTVQASVVRDRDDPRSRVIAMPERIWSDAVVLQVPPRGEAVRIVRLPRGVVEPAAAAGGELAGGAGRVLLEPRCASRVEVG